MTYLIRLVLVAHWAAALWTVFIIVYGVPTYLAQREDGIEDLEVVAALVLPLLGVIAVRFISEGSCLLFPWSKPKSS